MMETNTGVVTYPVTYTLGHFLERELQFFFTFLTFKKKNKNNDLVSTPSF